MWNALGEIILILVAFTVIIGGIKSCSSKAEGAASEELCRTTNALYANVDPTKGLPFGRLSPDACKSQDVNDVPTEGTPKILKVP